MSWLESVSLVMEGCPQTRPNNDMLLVTLQQSMASFQSAVFLMNLYTYPFAAPGIIQNISPANVVGVQLMATMPTFSGSVCRFTAFC